jgi:transcriptional regulator with XRE-family HTH domain
VTLGQRIKALRDKRGLNQSELARRCAVAQATISRLESGDLQDVQTAIAKRLARVLGVSLDYLVGTYEDDEPAPRPPQALARG